MQAYLLAGAQTKGYDKRRTQLHSLAISLYLSLMLLLVCMLTATWYTNQTCIPTGHRQLRPFVCSGDGTDGVFGAPQSLLTLLVSAYHRQRGTPTRCGNSCPAPPRWSRRALSASRSFPGTLQREMIWWTGLAPWEFEFTFPGSLTSTAPCTLNSVMVAPNSLREKKERVHV